MAPCGGELYIGMNDGRYIADMCREHCDNEAQTRECEANARLIAAAPDLLAACQRAVRAAENPEDFIEGSAAYENLKAAILKATEGK